MDLKFEWDQEKSDKNVRKRDISFENALRVFKDPNRIQYEDIRRDYGEKRMVVLGLINGRLMAVVYTIRNDAYRIISARKGNRREQRKYRQVQVDRR